VNLFPGRHLWEQAYFTNPAYLRLVEARFGARQRANVEAMTKVKLHRRLLGDPPPAFHDTVVPRYADAGS